MRNGLRSTATAAALIAGVIAAGAQGAPQPSTQVQPPAQKQDEQPKQKARPQPPAPGRVQQRREPEQPKQEVQPKQGTTPQPGSRPEPRATERRELREPAAKQPAPREQKVERRERREQSGDKQEQRERAGSRSRDWDSFNDNERTRIRAGFGRQHRTNRADINFEISIGRSVPRYVRTYPVPRDVWIIWPEYRRYIYIWVGDEILVINPRTNRIVAILPA